MYIYTSDTQQGRVSVGTVGRPVRGCQEIIGCTLILDYVGLFLFLELQSCFANMRLCDTLGFPRRTLSSG